MAVEVIPVSTSREQKQFLHLPWSIYRGDANWVPPLRRNQRELCGFARHPFYDAARSQAFLAVRDGQAVGRILAIRNSRYDQKYNESTGFFGFFESDSPEVAAALFATMEQHHRAEGCERIVGPVNPSMNYECGLLIDGFDSPPVFMMTYNPPTYPQMFEDAGYSKAHDLYAYLGHTSQLKDNQQRWDFIAQRLQEKIGFSRRTMQRAQFGEELRGFLDVYNRALQGSWGFVPISDAEMEHMAQGMKHLIVPELTGVVEIDGQRVGVTFGMLDYNPRIRQINGKLFPFGFWKLLSNKRRITRMRLISTNVVPEYQESKGMGLTLFSTLIPQILEWGMEDVEFSWVLESNRLSRATLERCGTRLYKTYRMYEKAM